MVGQTVSDPQYFFVLTFEYFDKSSFKVCGVTDIPYVANAWREAGDGQHKVYRIMNNSIKNYSQGWEEWK
jgi:hypothetical protein